MDDQFLKDFQFDIPVEIEKANDGKWKIKGCASTGDLDQQGEMINVHGLDISNLKSGRGLFNYDHLRGPENVIGIVEDAEIKDNKLFVEGYLLKNTDKAKCVYNIMESLDTKDKQRMGLSVEGKILKRSIDGKQLVAAKVDHVALTLNPVNPNTFVNLVKSLGDYNKDLEEGKEVETEEDRIAKSLDEVANKISDLVIEKVTKAMMVGDYNIAPSSLSDGVALQTESAVCAEDSEDERKRKKIKDILGDKLFAALYQYYGF